MAARDTRIEIVPFPDGDAAPTVDVATRSGLTPVDEPELDEPEAVEPELHESEAVETEAVETEAVEPDEPEAVESELPEPEAEVSVPVPVPSTRHREAQAVPHRPVAADEEVRAVPVDDTSLRATSISGRLLFLTLGTVTLVALVVLTSIWGVARVSGAGRDIAAVAAAKETNGDVLDELRYVQQDPTASTQRLSALADDAEAVAERWAPGRTIAAADSALDDYLASRRAGGDATAAANAADAAVEARTELNDVLRARRTAAVDRSELVRTQAISVVLVIFVLGSVALILIGRLIGRSVVAPVIGLGRTLRRFGDGDLRARSSIAPDEIGTLARSFNAMADSVTERVGRLTAIAERDAQLRSVGDALDLADRETDVYRILERALSILTPDNPGELLVNEPTSPRLWQVSTNPTAGPGGCPVESADACPAMRRAQAVVFDGPEAINACPQLRRHETPCSAACVPVGVNGHLLGVVHVTAPEHEPPAAEVVEQLVTLAGQVGVRVGAQRTLETTRLQASTDGLTGLANRRMLEARLGDLMRGGVSFALAVADVDRFKQLNDNFGHETGDRALQLFAKVLEDNVRGHDVVARYGGEEFVLVYPELTVKKAMEVIERIRLALERAIEAAGLPPFTCSFGVTHSSSADTVDGIVRIADAGLLMAKDLGRNRVVFADLDLAAEVFGGGTSTNDVIDLTDADAEADAEVSDAVADPA